MVLGKGCQRVCCGERLAIPMRDLAGTTSLRAIGNGIHDIATSPKLHAEKHCPLKLRPLLQSLPWLLLRPQELASGRHPAADLCPPLWQARGYTEPRIHE